MSLHGLGFGSRPQMEPLEPRVLLDAAAEEQALQLFSVSPALFVENQGQWADEVPTASTGGAASEASPQGPAMASGDDIPVELVGQWGGHVTNAVVAGNYAYVCRGFALGILDIRDPARPVEVGSVLLPEIARSVAVSGNLAYVADYTAGLQIIDVSNPSAPVWRGGYDTHRAWDVFVSGNLAYVADYDAGLQIIDVSDPSAPVWWRGYYTSGPALGVYVSGNLAYVAESHAGLQIMDVSDPSAPVWRGGYDTSGYACGVFVSGNLAYVADDHAGLQIIDVSNPAAPVRRGGYDTSGQALGVFVCGNLAYVADYDDGLQIIDVSNPAAPWRRGGYDTSGYACGVFVSGNLAYVADGSAGLQIIDVSDPSAPVWRRGDYTRGYAYGVFVSGNLTYVADWDAGLQIIDVSNPSVPVWRGGYDTRSRAQGVFVSGNLAYVANTSAGLQIIDVSDPSAPVWRGGYTTSGWWAYGVFVSGNLAYVADEWGGLQIIDVSNPSAPVWRGGYDTSGYPYDVFVSGNLAYVADSSAGLQIIDVSNPAAPVWRGGYDTSGTAYDVFVSGNLAYVADGEAGLQVIDVSDPSAPVRRGGYDTSSYALGVFVSGNLAYVADMAYVADSVAGLQIIDVSDPAAPLWRGGYDTSGHARDVFVSGNLAYVADGSEGLAILRVGLDAGDAQQWVYDSAFLTDDQFDWYWSMGVEEVRSFLAGHNSYFRQPVADVDGVVFDMASVIVDAASQYQVNPQVLLATLEKESVAVTTPTRPSETRMSLLMGAGAASTARAQVYEAARLYRAYLDELDTSGATRSGWQVGVAKTTADGVRVVPATQAVAALFTYTPYAGAQWGGNQPQWGGTYLFHYYWNALGFESAAPSLAAPTGLTASAASESAIALAWDALPGAAGYHLERREGTDGAWATVATLGAGATGLGAEPTTLGAGVATSGAGLMTYLDSTLSLITTYFYRLAAYWDAGSSPYSSIVSVSPLYATMPWTTGIEPVTPEPTGRPQPFTIYGSNFDLGATVTFRHLDSGLPGGTPYEITADRVTISDTCITFNQGVGPNFGTAAGEWEVVVTNPNVQSSKHYFSVLPVGQAPARENPVIINQDRFVELLEQEDFISEMRTLGQVVGLDETRNYTSDERASVNERAESVPFNKQQQEEGVRQLLTFIQNDRYLDLTRDQHIRWAAYMLATAYHETGHTWNPVQENYDPPAWEYFEGRYASVNGNAPYGTGDGFRYRGRGYAQLTGKELYERFGTACAINFTGPGDTNKVLEPALSYAIMSCGMRHGLYTLSLRGLGYYISDTADPESRRNEYVAARDILNPGDSAGLIADYAMELEQILKAALSHDYPAPGVRRYAQNGSFEGGSLAYWNKAGDGPVQGGAYGALLTTGSPITLYQVINTPPENFEVTFGYLFLTTTGTLDVLLDSVVLGTVSVPDEISEQPSTFGVVVSDLALRGLDEAVLTFRFDGPTGSQVLLSNIVLGEAQTGPVVPEITGHVIAGGLEQRSAVGELRVSFTGDVSASLGPENLLLENLDTGQAIEVGLFAVGYDAATNTAIWTFPGLADGLLPEGNYRATILADGLADAVGTPVVDDHGFDFHVLKGDATGDAKVNIFDLLKVQQNYLLPPGGGRDDNADVTGDGAVNVFDLLMVRQNYLRELAPVSGGGSQGAPAPLAESPQPLTLEASEPQSTGAVTPAPAQEVSVSPCLTAAAPASAISPLMREVAASGGVAVQAGQTALKSPLLAAAVPRDPLDVFPALETVAPRGRHGRGQHFARQPRVVLALAGHHAARTAAAVKTDSAGRHDCAEEPETI